MRVWLMQWRVESFRELGNDRSLGPEKIKSSSMQMAGYTWYESVCVCVGGGCSRGGYGIQKGSRDRRGSSSS